MSQHLANGQSYSHNATPFVIAVIGGNNVGKTTLCRNLSEATSAKSTNEECSIFCKENSEKQQSIYYKDYSALSLKLIEDLPIESPNILLALFRDSVSYGQLYEFFQNVTAKTEGNNQQLKSFWEDIENLILVYSEVQSQKEVQIDQLFGILTEQIRNFNRTATIKQFVLKRDPDNYQYLAKLIEKTLQAIQIQRQSSAAEENIEDKSTQQQKVVEKINEIQKEGIHIQEIGQQLKEISLQIMNSIQQKIRGEVKQSPSQPSNSLPEQYIQNNENLSEEFFQKYQEHPVSNHLQIIQEKQISHEPLNQVQSIVQLNMQQKILSSEESQLNQNLSKVQKLQEAIQQEKEIQQMEGNLPQLELAGQSQQFQPTLNAEVEGVVYIASGEETQREQEHYQQVYDKLMQKISSEDIQDTHKDSYKNLFEEFRRTSKEQSKISKELHQYWKQKIEKLEEEEEQESQKHETQAEQQDQFPQEEQQESLQTGQQSIVGPKEGKGEGQKELLKPQTGYQKRPPHRQKSTAETKPCMCVIM